MQAPRDSIPCRIAVVTANAADVVKLRPVIDRLGCCAVAVDVGDETGERLAQTLREGRLDAMILHGDDDASLRAARSAVSQAIPVIRVGAGMRSADESLPEERNRTLIDHLAHVCAAPSELAARRLVAEGADPARVSVTGSTTVELVATAMPDEAECMRTRRRYGVQLGRFVFATLGHPETVEDPKTLAAVLDALARSDVPVVIALDRRAERNVHRFGMHVMLEGMNVVDDLSPSEAIGLIDDAAVVVTDSGEIQEAVSVLGRFAVVVRPTTDRPEVLGTFAELATPTALAARVEHHIAARTRGFLRGLSSPFGDGSASARIVHLTMTTVGY